MRAAVLVEFGAPLEVRETADPTACGGEVVVEVLAACVAPYAGEVFSGQRRYPLVPPVVPGIGGWAVWCTSGRTPPGCAWATWCGATARYAPGTTH